MTQTHDSRPVRARRSAFRADVGSREGRGLRGPENGREERMAQVVEDVKWLVETGEHPLRWPERVGSPNCMALRQMLRRAKESKLAAMLDPYL